MALKRMDNVGIVVEDLGATIAPRPSMRCLSDAFVAIDEQVLQDNSSSPNSGQKGWTGDAGSRNPQRLQAGTQVHANTHDLPAA
jgi:hypothetical protein